MLSALEYEQSLGFSGENIDMMTITNYGVRCVTLSGVPQSGEGTCDSGGNFNVSLASATNVPIGCFVIQGSGPSAAIVAVLAFQGTSTGLDGKPQRQGSYVAGNGTTGVNFGTVTVDLTKGQATVQQASITQVGGANGSGNFATFADITGTWTIHSLGATPTGYTAICAAGAQNCNGPVDGQSIYFSQYNALDNLNHPHTGLGLWASSGSLTSCGGEGVTMPTGWTVAANANNPNASLLNHAISPTTFADPATISIQNNGGQNFCNIAQDGTHTHCADIGATYTWGVSGPSGPTAHWGFTPAQCEFYCTLNGNWNGRSGCPTEQNVNWNGFGTALSGVTPAFSAGSWTSPAADGVTVGGGLASYLGGIIQFGKTPKNRFMGNELVISGVISLTELSLSSRSSPTI